ncbi:hypothetical protein BI081_gp074 [Mycobacterium phage Tonenili]|uniref:Helix-turn-helix DNA binding domain protein n=1 Tax=Mycobacterium phage Tonenili TaxID=1891703 RepID=A0A1C9EH62_9CAUD|nr:hypothetical protein BI081_gp074 [Mycobacterium phage Tonenili]AON96825.1 hypothetical protein SEA_TONENILI_74 [Mycobacterium phage Tonenili]
MSKLTPTQELILEVLAARSRLGEQFWTFPTRTALVRAARSLENTGFVWCDTAPTPRSFRVGLTEQGQLACIDPGYTPPVERTSTESVRRRMHEAVDRVLDGL